MVKREQKITLGAMRASGVRGLLIYCSDYKCAHWTLSADPWPDEVRLSDIEPLFVCKVCGKRGADVRPDFHREKAEVVHWSSRFDDPIPRRPEAVTLKDAGGCQSHIAEPMARAAR
jgi:hypothetical protein